MTTPTKIEVEIALVKVKANGRGTEDVLAQLSPGRAVVIDTTAHSTVLRAEGTPREIDECIKALQPLGVEELVRSGRIVIDRGASQFAHLLND